MNRGYICLSIYRVPGKRYFRVCLGYLPDSGKNARAFVPVVRLLAAVSLTLGHASVRSQHMPRAAQNMASETSFSRSMRRFQVAIFGTA